MSAKVHIQVKSGSQDGEAFSFTEHDTFIFGRMEDCHARISNDDMVSRHHFILEVNPPQVCLRDLGSLNGTYVNRKKFGGRNAGETPEQGAQRRYPEAQLKNGDSIQVGVTSMEVRIEAPRGEPQHKADPQLADISELSSDELAKLFFAGNGDLGRKPRLRIPGYDVGAEIGRGGYGAVYNARRSKDGVNVAVKIMASRADADAAAIEKFKREVDVTGKLRHPNIVRLLDHGAASGLFYFVMDFCDGGNVWDLVRNQGGRLPPTKALPIILQTLEGLAFAHEKGFVHRDIKPQNILLHKGVARLSDFGLSKNFQQAGLSGMSITGHYAGTAYFMPREQITNFKYAKPVSDVWSMGASIYHILTGAFPLPFAKNRDPIDVILNEEIIPIRKRDASVHKPFAQVIDKALARKSKDRYQTAKDLLDAIKMMLP